MVYCLIRRRLSPSFITAAGESALRRMTMGATTSLVIMIARLTVATMTIPVAAEIPPMKAATVTHSDCRAIGRYCT